MEKIALVSDTTCDLSNETINRYHIKLLPFYIHYREREYKDRYEISPAEVYEKLAAEVPKSSTPSVQDIEDLFSQLEKEGFTHGIFITLSSGLSCIYETVKMVSAHHPAIKSFVYDSKSISCGEGCLVEKCAELMESGQTFAEITELLPQLRQKEKLFFIVGTLEYLVKGGRIGKVSGTIGELLNIKPIITLNEDGKYITYAKLRGRKQSLNKMLEIGRQVLEKGQHKIRVMSGAAPEEALYLVNRLKELPNAVEVVYGGNISPVAGMHSGPGLVGVVFIENF